MIPFNKPYISERGMDYIKECTKSGHLSGNGPFTKKCHELFEGEYGFSKCLLTTSCTDALEMAAILLNIKPGDEVIIPSYTFVSTALAFARQGATIVFADSRQDNPCIDEEKIEHLITNHTKAIVPVHYAGIACEMDKIMEVAEKYNLVVVEDAAHAFGNDYKGRILGSIGQLGCFSFHETKVIHCGEGGMLSVNDIRYFERAEIIWEKGTNRGRFFRGEVDKYEWIDNGSSFLLADINAALLYSQLEEAGAIISNRAKQNVLYYNSLLELGEKGLLKLPSLHDNLLQGSSFFFIETINSEIRQKLINYLKTKCIQAVTHYLDLAQSPYIYKYQRSSFSKKNANSIRYQDTILRLPAYYSLEFSQIQEIATEINNFYRGN